MKKIIMLFHGLLSICILYAQQPDFDKMTGEWKIEASMQGRQGEAAQDFSGTAVWDKVYGGRYMHERFEFEFKGTNVTGEAFLGESKRFKRFEFVQVDNVNPAMFTLTGNWNDSTKTLELNSIPGGIPLKWNYVFLEDGSFIKKMLLPQPDGSFHVQSQYHYIKK